MSDLPVMRGKDTETLPASLDASQDHVLRRASMIAQAGDALPRSYRGNPGAVLLAMEWARARDIDLLTAIQTVAFIDGKPVIDATMQRALARRAGYRVVVEHADISAARVAVFAHNGERLGDATFTMQDAERAGLTGKANWRQHPRAMLVARATTQALRWHAPEVMVGMLTADEAAVIAGAPAPVDEPLTATHPDVDSDSVVVVDDVDSDLMAPPDVDVEVEPGGPVETPNAAPPPVAQRVRSPRAELVDRDLDSKAHPMTRGEALAAIERAKARGVWPAVANALADEGVPVRPSSCTERQAQRIIDLVEQTIDQQTIDEHAAPREQ